MRFRLNFTFTFTFCVTLSCYAMFAQDFRATLGGRVLDSSASVLPRVAVTATNVDTNVKAETVSNEAGEFVFPPLVPGRYVLMAEKAGFKKFVREGIVLNVQDKIDVNLSLQVGEVSTSVQVAGQLVAVETATATTGQIIARRMVSDLPLNGRNPYLLSGLSAGVLVNNPPQVQRTFDVGGTNSITTGGPQTRGGGNNEFILDGAPAEGSLNFVPSISATQEFKVQTNTFDAEYGRSAGAIINVNIKSGTNQFHGEAYEFLRNSALDSTDFFTNRSGLKKPVFQFNLFGASAGGPVRVPKLYNGKDRTFFFFNYEAVRQGSPGNQQLHVPTDLERSGDFSQTVNSRGEVVTIYDPLNPAPNPGGGFRRSPFAGNRIPAGRIDPVAAKMIGFYPKPTLGVTPLGTPNFSISPVNRDDYDQYIARVDHTVTAHNQFFLRLETSARDNPNGPTYKNIADVTGGPFKRLSRGVSLQDTHIISPSAILTVRYGFARLVNQQKLVSEGFDFRTLGFPDSLYQATAAKYIPYITIQDFASLSQIGAFISPTDGHTLQATFSTIHRKHAIKFGGDFRVARYNRGGGQSGAASGQFNFDTGFTQGPDPNVRSDRAGIGIATFLLGAPASGQLDNNAEAAFQGTYYAAFVQDDIRVSSKLTINAGLRYNYEGPLTERFNRMTRGFDYNATSPVQPPGPTVRGGLLFTDSGNRAQAQGDYNNFAPVLGLAYRLGAKTVVRAGYGLFNARTGGGVASSAVQPGFSATTGFVSSIDGGITPANFLSNPFPQGLVKPSGGSLGLATFVGQAVSFVDPGFIQPYTQNFVVNIQHELPRRILVEVGYTGIRGSHLVNRNRELNQLPPSQLSLGTQLQSTVSNPFVGLIKIGSLSGATVSRQQLLRPYPEFTSLVSLNPRNGNSGYHSLVAKVERQFSAGFSFLASYTLSKLIDDVNQNVAQMDNYNLRLERALSEYDRTHRLVTTVLWELPFGRTKRFLNSSAVADKLLGGWQINTIHQLQSGRPLTLTATPTTTLFGGGLRPNTSGGSAAKTGRVEDRLNAYFDTSLFSVPPPFFFGNTARTLSNVREPRLNLLDFSVIKNTHIYERFTLQFRAEFFNVLNHPIFNPPATTVGSSTLGRITSQFNSPRQIQFALKIIF